MLKYHLNDLNVLMFIYHLNHYCKLSFDNSTNDINVNNGIIVIVFSHEQCDIIITQSINEVILFMLMFSNA